MTGPIKILDGEGEELISFEPTDIFYQAVGTYVVAACDLMLYRPILGDILKGTQQIATGDAWIAGLGPPNSLSGMYSCFCGRSSTPLSYPPDSPTEDVYAINQTAEGRSTRSPAP